MGRQGPRGCRQGLTATPRETQWGVVLASNTKATAPLLLRGLPAREIGPNERPLLLERARFLSLIYGVVVYKVGPAHRSLGIVSNACISFKLNNTHVCMCTRARACVHTHTQSVQAVLLPSSVPSHVGQ